MNWMDWLRGAVTLAASVYAFNLLFWEQGALGANISFYAVLMTCLMIFLHPRRQFNLKQTVALAAVSGHAHVECGGACRALP